MKKLLIISFLSLFISQVYADFTANVTKGCAPLLITFNETSGNAVYWEWDFGDNSTTIYTNPASHQYSTPGVYTVKLTVTYQDSSEQFEKTITIIGVKTTFTTPQLPVNDRKVCNKEVVNFSNTSSYYDSAKNSMVFINQNTTGLTYLWDFDGQGTSNLRHGQFAFNVANSKFVKIRLTITDTATGCSNSYLDSIFVIRPVANYTSGTHVQACPELQVQFYDQSSGMDTTKTRYQWIFGDTLSLDNNISPIKNPIHTYQYAGNFDVSLIVTDERNCTDTMLKSKYVQIGGPYGTFTMDTLSGNVPLRVTFTFDVDMANADTLWLNYGDGSHDTTTFVGAPMRHTYTTPEIYMPSMCLIKWAYNSLSGQMEKCMRCFISTDTLFVNDPNDIRSANKNNTLQIYPNPSNDKLTLDNGQGVMTELYVYDVIGREVKYLTVNETLTSIDVSNLQNGIYFLKINTEKGVLTRKFQVIK